MFQKKHYVMCLVCFPCTQSSSHADDWLIWVLSLFDVLMCWCVYVFMCLRVYVFMCWCVDVLTCWWLCWCVDVLSVLRMLKRPKSTRSCYGSKKFENPRIVYVRVNLCPFNIGPGQDLCHKRLCLRHARSIDFRPARSKYFPLTGHLAFIFGHHSGT